MPVFPALTRSQRAALLGGASLIALQGLSACASKPVATSATYTPQQDAQYTPMPGVQYAPVPTDGYVEQGYRPADGMATTLAVGEEDGSGPIPVEPDGGIGDGAGPIPFEYTTADPVPVDTYTSYDSGTVTTLAVGEEDGSGPIPVEPDGGIGDGAGPIPFEYTTADPVPVDTYTSDDLGTVTTLAIGEEDGTGPIPVEPDGGIGDGAGPPPFATTYAIGEEGGSSYGDALGSDMMTTLAIGEEG